MSLEGIAGKLERLRWNHALWGVSERQAWHVIGRLCEMYEQLLREQEVRYEALLAEARAAATPQQRAVTAPAGVARSPRQAPSQGAGTAAAAVPAAAAASGPDRVPGIGAQGRAAGPQADPGAQAPEARRPRHARVP